MNGIDDSSFFIRSINLNSSYKPEIDYGRCFICQSIKLTKNKHEEPLPNTTQQSYASLCRDLASFIECKSDSVPSHIEPLFESAKQLEEILTKHKAVYHKSCRDDYNNQKLQRLQNRCKKLRFEDACDISYILEKSETVPNFEKSYNLALQETIKMIENSRQSPKPEFFKLSQIAKAISERLDQSGCTNNTLHTTRLKDQLISAIPGFRADKIGREIFLSFDENVKHLISNALKNDTESNEQVLEKAVDILRGSYIGENKSVFSGSLNENFCPEKTVSKKLVKFISSLTGGDAETSKLAENIAQLIQFNSVKSRKPNAAYVRHNIQREQPLPIYIGLLVHSLCGKRSLIDELFEMGMSVSYSRVLDIERALASKVCEIYMKDNCVCPPHLQLGVFTTAAADNIDHNPRSNSANYSYHGTGISVIQHHNQPSNDGFQQVIHLEKADFLNKSKPSLPKNYYEVPSLPKVDGEVPLSWVNWESKFSPKNPLEYVKNWLQRNNKLMGEESSNALVSWSAYNSRSCADISKYKSTSVMLPLIKDNINSPSVVRHTMDIVISITKKINPTQTPVWTGDEPVYAIGKQVQWLYPEKYGEDKIVLMLGGLHIEKSFLSVIGTWLEGSGWEEALVTAGITTPGRAEGLLKSEHIKKARYAHEVSIVALNILLLETFESNEDTENCEYFEWIETKRKLSPQFQYWITTMELQAILLQFVKSLRTGNFDEYVLVLESMCPWYLVTDHHHYGRWLPVMVCNMKQLPTKHPEVYQEFKKGHFTSRQTNKAFSCISDDHLHEQNNKMVKGSSSLLGMLNDESALIKWMVSGPEISRLIWEYKNISSNTEDLRHHEDCKWFQLKFANDVKNLVNILRNKGPFSTIELTTIGSERKSMNAESTNNVMAASQLGSTKYRSYVIDRLITTKESIHRPIKQSQLSIFQIKPVKKINKEKMKLAAANMDSNLFCKLFIACESRKGNVAEFFMHENNQYPPSLSEFGSLRQQTCNDDMLNCLLKPNKMSESSGAEMDSLAVDSTTVIASAVIIDAFSHVQGVPISVMTVKDYSEKMFHKFINQKCETYSRVDVLFDVNQDNSLEEMTKEDCSKEKYVSLVDKETKLHNSKTWFAKFLNNATTKTQFLKILATDLFQNTLNEDKTVFSTMEHVVISKSKITEIDFHLPIENMNTRILLHVEHAVRNGHQEILISTADFNIITVALYAFHYLVPNLKKLWIELVNCKPERVISIHGLYELHKYKCHILPFFDAFTGYRTTSAFHGIGKTTAWNTLTNFPKVIPAMSKLIKDGTNHLCNESMEILERFTIMMYDSRSKLTKLHESRRILFTKKVKPRAIDRIPPTRDALEQHVKRSLLQSHIWTQCLHNSIKQLEPTEWGWKHQENSAKLVPVWTTIPIVADHYRLYTCKCKGKCTGRCKCVENLLPCTMLCDCEGNCESEVLIKTKKKV